MTRPSPWQRTLLSKGFTLAEVLASILVISLFTVAAMQAVVVAALFQSNARRFAEASNWIQDDLENIKIVAYDLCQTRFAQRKLAAPAQNTNTITLAFIEPYESDYKQAMPPEYWPNNQPMPPEYREYPTRGVCSLSSVTDGFRVGDEILIGSDAGTNRITAISGDTITLANTITSYRSAGTRVYARCRAGKSEGGFAAYLQSLLPPLGSGSGNTSTGTRTFINDTFSMSRTATRLAPAPFQTLELAYVVRDSNNNIVAQVTTEVVPNAFFRCP
ncbi:prepilin-type N-terminal cleavage/methylation domain-containing protein [Parathermosynechococcus lividus]|nr:prepilin-type N-terminal cleavage/methylation domain-containing protein [Thermostichus lividus]